MPISTNTAVRLAADADRDWQRALNAMGVDRYSQEAKGKPGTILRNLWEAKVYADEMLSEAYARSRKERSAP